MEEPVLVSSTKGGMKGSNVCAAALALSILVNSSRLACLYRGSTQFQQFEFSLLWLFFATSF
jgi:hypothetical protein